MATLRNDVVATSWQRSAKVVTILETRNSTKCLTTSGTPWRATLTGSIDT